MVSTGIRTRRIQDGQTNTVDGGAGTVTIGYLSAEGRFRNVEHAFRR
jgi:hypothetical protein